jgi:hypothetical protein
MDPPEGTFVLFSAGAGQEALDRLSDDDKNPNSVFTRSLIPLLRQQNLELGRMAKLVRQKVKRVAAAVRHTQTPAVYNEVTGDFYLLPPKAGAKNDKIVPPPLISEAAREWTAIQNTRSKAVLEAFIAAHPNSVYAKYAKARLKELKKPEVAIRVSPKMQPKAKPALTQRQKAVKQDVQTELAALDGIYDRMRRKNRGPFARYFGMYGARPANRRNCRVKQIETKPLWTNEFDPFGRTGVLAQNLYMATTNIFSFDGNTVTITSLFKPQKPRSSRLRYIGRKHGTRIYRTDFTGDLRQIGFRNGEVITEINMRKSKYSVYRKCHNPSAMLTAAQTARRDRLDHLKAYAKLH